jgi:hypothetical protein
MLADDVINTLVIEPQSIENVAANVDARSRLKVGVDPTVWPNTATAPVGPPKAECFILWHFATLDNTYCVAEFTIMNAYHVASSHQGDCVPSPAQ